MKIISNLLVGLIAIMAVIFIHDEVLANPIALAGPIPEALLRSYPVFSGIQAYQLKDRGSLLNKEDFPELNMKVVEMVEKEKAQRYRMTLI